MARASQSRREEIIQRVDLGPRKKLREIQKLQERREKGEHLGSVLLREKRYS